MNLAWVRERVSLAVRLARGDCGGTYAEAVLVVSSLVSGIAADLWPRAKDGVRFIETWVRYADPKLRATAVSVPMLIERLLQTGDDDLAKNLRPLHPDGSLPFAFWDSVVTGDAVDAEESVLFRIEPRLALATVRRWSYPVIFYRHFRNGYVHEYEATGVADEVVLSGTSGDITYQRWNSAPFLRINFSAEWLCRVALSIAEGAESDWNKRPLAQLDDWWAPTAT